MHRRFSLSLLLLSFLLITAAHGLEQQPLAEYHARREALAVKLNGGVALYFAAPEPVLDFMPYRQDEDFYYLTGWNEPGAALLIEGAAEATSTTPSHKYREILFVPTRDLRREKFTGEKLDASSSRAPQLTGVGEVKLLLELPKLLSQIGQKDRQAMSHIWAEEDAGRSVIAWTATTLGMDSPPAFADARELSHALRSVKGAGEVDLIRKATHASMVAQRAMMRGVHPGVKERAIAGLIIDELMQEGCERPSYAPIVGSGLNSTVLHYSENSETMQDGDVVVVDAAGEYSMYASDITRTVPVNGHFTARQREVYDIVLGAQRAAMAAFVPGKSRINDPLHVYTDSLDTIAWKYMNEHGRDLHGEPLGKYFIHGIGHLVGIDVHDPYDYTQPIQKGMVFTIEPGIYILEEKLGVRIEDIYYAEPTGKLLDLTEELPHSSAEVEAAMKH